MTFEEFLTTFLVSSGVSVWTFIAYRIVQSTAISYSKVCKEIRKSHMLALRDRWRDQWPELYAYLGAAKITTANVPCVWLLLDRVAHAFGGCLGL